MYTTPCFSPEVRPGHPADADTARDLLETLTAHADGCVGMAANMIGVAKRIIAVEAEDGYLVLFNPVILKKSGPYNTEEGCLSLEACAPPNAGKASSAVRNCRRQAAHPHLYRLDGPDHPA